jgi:hypothetical protein
VPEVRPSGPLSAIGQWLPWGGLAIIVVASLVVASLVGRGGEMVTYVVAN